MLIVGSETVMSGSWGVKLGDVVRKLGAGVVKLGGGDDHAGATCGIGRASAAGEDRNAAGAGLDACGPLVARKIIDGATAVGRRVTRRGRGRIVPGPHRRRVHRGRWGRRGCGAGGGRVNPLDRAECLPAVPRAGVGRYGCPGRGRGGAEVALVVPRRAVAVTVAMMPMMAEDEVVAGADEDRPSVPAQRPRAGVPPAAVE